MYQNCPLASRIAPRVNSVVNYALDNDDSDVQLDLSRPVSNVRQASNGSNKPKSNELSKVRGVLLFLYFV